MANHMKGFAVLTLLLSVLSGTNGCGQQKSAPVPRARQEAKMERHTHQENDMQNGPLRHGHHDHAFTNPAEQAKKWNDPERDTWQRPGEIVTALALRPGATVADIGAGTGYMVAHLSNAVGEGGAVVGIDASAEMVAYLEESRERLGPARITARKVGPDDPEFQSTSMDAVLTLDTWHHVNGREAYAGKVYDGLKRCGRFVVVDYEVDSDVGPPKAMRLTPEQIQRELEAAGFRTEVIPESMPRHYMVVGYKD